MLSVGYFDIGRLAGIVASAGTSARALDPPELVAAVVARLGAVAGNPRSDRRANRMTGERERLPRLLALVPYLQAHPGVSAAQAADDFEITEDQLRRDLQLLWMCGLPGHGPGDLIDLSFEGETVSVIFDAGMSRPLRLTAEEALALVIGLRTLAEVPEITDGDAINRALAKIETVAGGAVAADTVERVARYRGPAAARPAGGDRHRPGAVAALLHRHPR